MDSQRPPTETERDSFYNGLPSRPKLVARSSTIPLRLGLDGWSSERKMLTVVGEHAIVSKWNDEPSSLRNDILGILTRQKVDWQAVDILRIGYADDEMPVILSISVSAGTPWEMGNSVARDCRQALVGHGLDDVHCEMKESRLVNLASVLQQDSHQYPPYFHSYMYHLSDRLGTSIASREVPYREGTKGIYLRRAGGEPDEIFALTCRHVCYLESKDETNRLLQHFILREDLDTRVFGHVAYTSDYALSNRVYIGPHDLRTLFPRTVRIQDPDDDGTLCIRGTVAVSELKDPKTKLTVGMRGWTLDLKFGLVNQVKSVTRRLLSDEDTFISMECGIVTERINNAFTERGDSGACVFDLEGRAVGMVTSGITRDEILRGDVDFGLDQAMDVTYTTPMEWLLEDMKACDLSMEILWERQQRLASRGEIR
ncbi:hypothetical protein LX36DRAFT_675934 [Colletotrichum falcatum]|nr:hypothetical protein LX36DRAFT_675934 [Colletotrichum falcatum]